LAGYFKFIGIYEGSLVRSNPRKIIVDPVKIEFFDGPRSFWVPIQTTSVVASDDDKSFVHDGRLHVGPGTHIAITVRTQEVNPGISQPFCENKLHETVATLALIHHRGLFAHKLYEGWLIEEAKLVAGGWVTRWDPVDIRPDIQDEIIRMRQHQHKDADTAQRFGLMSRFFAKALAVDPGEELFFYLWTILEIFPMQDTSDIRPLRACLAQITGRTLESVEKGLNVGRLCRTRGDLVHDGRLDLSIAELGETTDRLKLICTEVLRFMSGVPYSGSLDRYFK